MAVFQNGPLTNGIRGKVGDLIFQMVNGIQIVRSMPASIQDPNTPLQQIQRAAFAQAVIEWRQLNVEEREKWNFWASLRGNRQTHRAARRVDHSPKPTNTTLFDGHNGVVGQKSREADYYREHGDTQPVAIELQDPPPYNKTKNIPPSHTLMVIAVGSLGADWNPVPGKPDYDGLWWYGRTTFPSAPGSIGRAWVQPPYPIHSQRITSNRGGPADIWASFIPVPYTFHLWAWKVQVGANTVRIVTPRDGDVPAFVTVPYVWKSQMDLMDGEWQDTKGSAVIRFYLPDDLEEGLWQVYPTLVDLLGLEGAGTFEHPERVEM